MNLRSVLRPLATVGIAAGLAVPGAAYAESFTHHDATHDVQRYNFTTEKLKNAPHNKSADVVRTKLAYTHHNLTSTVWLRSGHVGHAWVAEGQLRTDSTRFTWLAEITPTTQEVTLSDKNGDPVTCDGITRDVAHGKGRVTVTVPASCINTPDWVKAGVAFAHNQDNFQFADDGLQKHGLVKNPQLALSPKLDRG